MNKHYKFGLQRAPIFSKRTTDFHRGLFSADERAVRPPTSKFRGIGEAYV